MLLYIIRHGETDWNIQGRLQGEKDNLLNANGRKLAEMTAQAFATIKIDLVISSPLTRALDTARIVLGNRDVPYITDPRLRELGWGEWDGIQIGGPGYEEIEADMDVFRKDPFAFRGAPGGETIGQLCARTKEFMDDLIANPDYQDKTILVSTHGVAMLGLQNSLQDIPRDFWQSGIPANCAVSIVKGENGKFSFVEREKIYYDLSLVKEFYPMPLK